VFQAKGRERRGEKVLEGGGGLRTREKGQPELINGAHQQEKKSARKNDTLH